MWRDFPDELPLTDASFSMKASSVGSPGAMLYDEATEVVCRDDPHANEYLRARTRDPDYFYAT